MHVHRDDVARINVARPVTLARCCRQSRVRNRLHCISCLVSRDLLDAGWLWLLFCYCRWRVLLRRSGQTGPRRGRCPRTRMRFIGLTTGRNQKQSHGDKLIQDFHRHSVCEKLASPGPPLYGVLNGNTADEHTSYSESNPGESPHRLPWLPWHVTVATATLLRIETDLEFIAIF